MGIAFTSNDSAIFLVGVGVGVMFLINMGGAHHLIVAIAAIAIIYVGVVVINQPLFALVGAAALFMIFVLKGKDDGEAGMGGYPMDMGYGGMPMGY